MVSLLNNQDKQRNRKSEKTPKTKIRLLIYNEFSLFYEKVKMILRSIRTFWYKGLAKTKTISSSKKRPPSLKNSSPGSKAIFQKSFYLVVESEYWSDSI